MENRVEVNRADIRPRYLGKDYYFVQPPLTAKVIQSWGRRRYHQEYERRRRRHTG
ncbi:MAG: hypothetical protein WBC70_01275 [Candidatus Aminicenantales bacterium]